MRSRRREGVQTPVRLQAGWWGLVAGAAMVVGALIAWFVAVPQKVVAAVMAFGAGVLISALAFQLVDKAEKQGGLTATVIGFIAGAVVFVAANSALARHRKTIRGSTAVRAGPSR